MDKAFARDVKKGLSSSPKYLTSKYFYDKKGDELFQQIMELDEYYLTRAEHEIFETHKDAILETFNENSFRLIEFGAGDGKKTKVLLKHFLENNVNFRYQPIDISQNVLNILESNLSAEFPSLKVKPVRNDYFLALQQLNFEENSKKVILFLGSNIGNFSDHDAVNFLQHIREFMNEEDMLLIGMDLKKDPGVILKAYNDPSGVTREFNMNLLRRINSELGGEFDIDTFEHFPTYDPLTGINTSYLISTKDQSIAIKGLDTAFYFRQWETVRTETSRKYSVEDIENLAARSGFVPVKNFYDSKKYFVDSIWTPVPEPAFGT